MHCYWVVLSSLIFWYGFAQEVILTMEVGILHEDTLESMGNPILELVDNKSLESQVFAFCNTYKIYVPQCQDLLAYMQASADEQGLNFNGPKVPLTVTQSSLSSKEVDSLQEFVNVLMDFDCPDRAARTLFKSHLDLTFSPLQLSRWQSPERYMQRDISRAFVPCNDTFWTQSGSWNVFPMWAHSGNKEVSTSRCVSKVVDILSPLVNPNSKICDTESGLRGKCNDDTTTWCDSTEIRNAIKANNCIIYSFGIGGIWTFEDFASDKLGCAVHAFDPTTSSLQSHMNHQHPNVFFHYFGLTHDSSGLAPVHETVNYGSMNGAFYTLSQIFDQLGHHPATNSPTVLKMDCEGCEWTSLRQVATETPHLLDSVCMLILEVHLSTPFNVVTSSDLSNVAFFWNYFVHNLGFRVSYFHKSPGAQYDRNVHPLLTSLGLERNVCCYELILVRNSCLQSS